MRKLSHERKCMVFIGDSLMAQTFNAFLNEFAREASLRNITERPHRLQIEMKEPYETLKSTRLFEVYKWRNASILRFTHSHHDDLEVNSSKQFILDTIDAECITSAVVSRRGTGGGGAVVVGNIGLHIDSLPVVELADRMNRFISFLGKDLRKLATNRQQQQQQHEVAVQVAFMETLPQHFDSVDGSYRLWKYANIKNDNIYERNLNKIPNSWDPQHPLYHCRVVDSAKKSITSSIAHFIIHKNSGEEEDPSTRIGYIETFKYFNAFPLMHYGYCQEDIRSVLQDCTHICAFAPPMWMPIWSQLEKFISSRKA